MSFMADERQIALSHQMAHKVDAADAEAEQRHLVASSGCKAERTVAPFPDSSVGAKLLPSVLSVTAGSVDVISFLSLGGLFVAHITGNLVVLAAHVVTGEAASLAPVLSVPVFIVVLGLIRLGVAGLDAVGHGSPRPLLALHVILLVSFMAVCVEAGSGVDPASAIAVFAGMLGVAAMAVQNAVVQICLGGTPATTVMTTGIAVFVMDIGAIVGHSHPKATTYAKGRVKRTWPAIVGFIIGCSLGAVLESMIGPWSLALPTGFGLLALALGF
jgi:uncharacterized membrane protein YoaK (UPF0700 family)